MRVRFLLPGLARVPVGGYKVVFEHANGLSARGHDVWIYYPLNLTPLPLSRQAARDVYRCVAMNARKSGGIPRQSVAEAVKLRMVPDLRWGWAPRRAEVVVATAWQTAEFVARYPKWSGRRVYLVQDYEHYMSGRQDVQARIAATYRHGMTHVAVSPVVADLVARTGAGRADLVENGIDLVTYHASLPIESPERCTLGFPTRSEPFKRTDDAIAVAEIVRREMKALRVWSFGGAKPKNVPDWVEYYDRPSDQELSRLYNRTAVFLTPSEYEGWGLPGSEAMACGAALVSADHGGVRAYAEHGVTAFLTPPRDTGAMARHILRLFQEPANRVDLAQRGCTFIQRFNWPRAVAEFERILFRTIGPGYVSLPRNARPRTR